MTQKVTTVRGEGPFEILSKGDLRLILAWLAGITIFLAGQAWKAGAWVSRMEAKAVILETKHVEIDANVTAIAGMVAEMKANSDSVRIETRHLTQDLREVRDLLQRRGYVVRRVSPLTSQPEQP